ncbi:hypothetical protein CkaCkLH20_03894 [Colletotrichum karsti]|uniref:FAD/NAD(P)-binding domain-containing protein n=1 Tax=Colletotrichum karsti TaxID=1095194 RepID=A0A9P6LNC8_9PEZI|nr:uncharacterized protein CkaCkLH20_03894 [Colletotrichum karsti]KAF9878402.1 hypothetical protein CkaCkLH20_03894 [Colletotrichum karsti]
MSLTVTISWITGCLVLAYPLLSRILKLGRKPERLSNADTTSQAGSHTLVVLGAGMAGVPLVHHLLKHTPASVGLRVVLVSPNDELLWAYATVRAILPDGFGDERIFHPLGPALAKYDSSKFEYVLGTAKHVDTQENQVVISTKDDEQLRTIDYDTLVIATGSSYQDAMPFKNLADTAATKNEIHNLRNKIAAATSIVVAGAGQTGVEVAAELGQVYGMAGTKDITLIADDALPLWPEARSDVRQTVADELAKLKVKIISNTRVLSATTQSDGRHSIVLATSSKGNTDKADTTATIVTDLYIPTFGVRPNTAFMAAAMLDRDGRIKVNRDTLQVSGHANVFALGDAANAQTATGKHADAQVRFLAPALQDLLAGRSMPMYKADDTFVFAVTLGPNRGTGQMGNMRLWGWIVRMTICKYLGTDYAPEIAAGNRTITQKNW